MLAQSNDTVCLGANNQGIPPSAIAIQPSYKVIRIYVDYTIEEIEWEKWRWTQLIVQYKSKGKLIESNMLRTQRIQNNVGKHTIYLDTKVPANSDQLEYSIWHAESEKSLCINSIKIVEIK
jgi:hypothetical protein